MMYGLIICFLCAVLCINRLIDLSQLFWVDVQNGLKPKYKYLIFMIGFFVALVVHSWLVFQILIRIFGTLDLKLPL